MPFCLQCKSHSLLPRDFIVTIIVTIVPYMLIVFPRGPLKKIKDDVLAELEENFENNSNSALTGKRSGDVGKSLVTMKLNFLKTFSLYFGKEIGAKASVSPLAKSKHFCLKWNKTTCKLMSSCVSPSGAGAHQDPRLVCLG